MPNRSVGALASLLFLAGVVLGEAQEQRFKIGGGAGLAVLHNPFVDLGRTAVFGGGLGYRFNDNLSLETGAWVARANRQYDDNGLVVDPIRALPAFRFEAIRYDLDATFFYHIGRREPFHAFLFGGGGYERRDETRTDLSFTVDENGVVIDRTEEVVLRGTSYDPQVHFGAGFDIYVLYNVAARAEFRVRIPQTTELWSRTFFFTASYYW